MEDVRVCETEHGEILFGTLDELSERMEIPADEVHLQAFAAETIENSETGQFVHVHGPAQELVDSGQGWLMEGSTGRMLMDMIENGVVVLGPEGVVDYWGNYIPSRYEVESGTKGSIEFAIERQLEMA